MLYRIDMVCNCICVKVKWHMTLCLIINRHSNNNGYLWWVIRKSVLQIIRKFRQLKFSIIILYNMPITVNVLHLSNTPRQSRKLRYLSHLPSSSQNTWKFCNISTYTCFGTWYCKIQYRSDYVRLSKTESRDNQ